MLIILLLAVVLIVNLVGNLINNVKGNQKNQEKQEKAIEKYNRELYAYEHFHFSKWDYEKLCRDRVRILSGAIDSGAIDFEYINLNDSYVAKGKSELYFYRSLIQTKEFDFTIYPNTKIEIEGDYDDYYYYPDFILEDDYGIYYDIEIDEPYTAKEKLPIHYIYDDDNNCDAYRNMILSDKGYVVIRFAESQIILHTKECIEYILLIRKQIHSMHIESISKNVIDFSVAKWSYDEADNLANEDFRKEYLDKIPKNNKGGYKIVYNNDIWLLQYAIKLTEEEIKSIKIVIIKKYKIDNTKHVAVIYKTDGKVYRIKVSPNSPRCRVSDNVKTSSMFIEEYKNKEDKSLYFVGYSEINPHMIQISETIFPAEVRRNIISVSIEDSEYSPYLEAWIHYKNGEEQTYKINIDILKKVKRGDRLRPLSLRLIEKKNSKTGEIEKFISGILR